MRTTVAIFKCEPCILRGYTAQETRLILEVLKDSGIRSVEITMNTEGALSMISEAVERFGDSLSIGAGTVLTMEQLQDVVAGRSRFRVVTGYVYPGDAGLLPGAEGDCGSGRVYAQRDIRPADRGS